MPTWLSVSVKTELTIMAVQISSGHKGSDSSPTVAEGLKIISAAHASHQGNHKTGQNRCGQERRRQRYKRWEGAWVPTRTIATVNVELAITAFRASSGHRGSDSSPAAAQGLKIISAVHVSQMVHRTSCKLGH